MAYRREHNVLQVWKKPVMPHWSFALLRQNMQHLSHGQIRPTEEETGQPIGDVVITMKCSTLSVSGVFAFLYVLPLIAAASHQQHPLRWGVGETITPGKSIHSLYTRAAKVFHDYLVSWSPPRLNMVQVRTSISPAHGTWYTRIRLRPQA